MATTCLLELHSAEDPLIAAAAAEGMASALLVPIARGGELIAMLALFSRTDRTPTGELMASVEEIAGQLGEIAQLKPPEPRWLSARM
jgi:GAF domain-containing protein